MFVALDLPAEARSELAAWRDELIEGRPDLRPVALEALHATLVFLGWQDEAAAAAIAEAAFGSVASAEAPVLRASGVKPLPPRDPRLFALDLDDEEGRASALQDRISRALAEGGWYTPEKRPFWPHITLARVKRRERRVAGLPETPPPAQPFRANELTLYRSTLRPQGALYEPLAQTKLGD
ncbi:MAG: 2,3-cyclic 3-phosphodiesterase [Thermoleophilaceae bacterium]|jgi:2'-5' RNA ligase|nr:2,3-cyclic 3-phosphodiesterase [Thermoleophilaceae bacterium]